MQYTGTGSTISSVTREGKQGFRGMISHGLKSIGRFYNANVEDAARQRTIDSLLKKRGKAGLLTKFEKELKERENEFCSYSKFLIRIVTWNLAGRKIPSVDFSPILIKDNPADIIIIVFQEVVNLNPRNVLQEGNNQSAIENLKRIIEQSLFNTGHPYSLLCQDDLVGIGLFIYAQKRLCSTMITRLETDSIKVGFGGKMGNKGGVAGRFNLLDTTICVLGCHLASGNEENDARKSQLIDIHNRAFQQEKLGKQNIYYVNEHDIKFICGDLNFRIPLNNYNVRSTIAEGNFSSLLASDQLIEALKNKEIPGFYEHEINFKPTYKFDFGTNTYDTSKKQRTPAWCDRILYNGEGVEPVYYDSVDLRLSDHRPVCAEFHVLAKEINEEVRKAIEEEISMMILEEEEEKEGGVIQKPEKIERIEKKKNLVDFYSALKSKPGFKVFFLSRAHIHMPRQWDNTNLNY